VNETRENDVRILERELYAISFEHFSVLKREFYVDKPANPLRSKGF